MKEQYDRLDALVVGFDQWVADRDRLFALLADEMRLAKAGALYVDEVIVASQASSITIDDVGVMVEREGPERSGQAIEDLLASLDNEAEAGLVAFMAALNGGCVKPPATETGAVFLLAAWIDGVLPSHVLPLASENTVRATEPKVMDRGWAEHLRGPRGLKSIEEMEVVIAKVEQLGLQQEFEGTLAEMKRVRTGGEPKSRAMSPTRSIEATLLSGVLGGLPAFPDADWDVIVDVRERLGASRVNFRAAIATAAEELKDCEDSDQLTDACASLRRRVVAPALGEIEAELEELGAVPTLLRMTQEAPTVGAIVTNLALVAGNPAGLGLSAAAHVVASAPVIASAVREAAHRRQARRELAARPFWLLREIDQSSR